MSFPPGFCPLSALQDLVVLRGRCQRDDADDEDANDAEDGTIRVAVEQAIDTRRRKRQRKVERKEK